MGVSGQRHPPAAIYPRIKNPLDKGWVGLRAGLDTEARGKIICLYRGSNPGLPVCIQDTILTELPQVLFFEVRTEFLNIIETSFGFKALSKCFLGSANATNDPMARVVSRRPFTAGPGFAPGSTHVGFVVDKVALGQVFLRVLRFSRQYIIPPSLSKLISSGESVIC
jgi:hypothetical protein